MNENKKAVIKIWLIENSNLHAPLEKFFWNIEPLLKDIDSIFLDLSRVTPKIVVFSEKLIKISVESAIKKTKETFDFEVISPREKIDSSSLYRIYSKNSINLIELKGGTEKDE